METCDEKKKSMWHFICHGEFNQCIFCGQSVCIYHGASNNGGFQGGHSGCSVACDTSYSWLCQGHMTKCELCNKPHCSYHSKQAAISEMFGGHLCTVHCDTSPHFRTQCVGSIHRCTFCPYQFCEYHYHPNSHALETGGGHVCPSVTTGAAVATAVGNAAYYSAGAAAITTFAVATGGQGVVLAGAALGGAVAGAGAKQALNVVDCNTARHTAGMCEGISSVCQYCQNSYCIYHLQAAEDLTDIVGGHCCEKFTANR